MNKRVMLPTMTSGDLIVVCDVGAYCGVLSSNYNMRERREERLITGEHVQMIRRGETYGDLLAPFQL